MIKILETSELKSVVGGASAIEYGVIPTAVLQAVADGDQRLLGEAISDYVRQ